MGFWTWLKNGSAQGFFRTLKKRPRTRKRAPRSTLAVERLETRDLLSTLVLLDFNGATTRMHNRALTALHEPADWTAAPVSSFVSGFSALKGSYADFGFLDFNGDGKLNQRDAKPAIKQIMAAVRGEFAADDVRVIRQDNTVKALKQMRRNSAHDTLVLLNRSTEAWRGQAAWDAGNQFDDLARAAGSVGIAQWVLANGFQGDEARNRFVERAADAIGYVVGRTLGREISPAEQNQDLQRLQAASQETPSVWFDDEVPRFVSMRVPVPASLPNNPVAQALDYLNEYRDLYLLADPDSQLRLERQVSDQIGGQHVFFGQQEAGIPVYGSFLSVHMDGGAVHSTSGNYLTAIPAMGPARVPAADAATIALEAVRAELHLPAGEGEVVGSPELMYYDPSILGDPQAGTHLAWRVTFYAGVTSWLSFVDAHDGQVLLQLDRSMNNRPGEDFDINTVNGASESNSGWNFTTEDDQWFDEDGTVAGARPDAEGRNAFNFLHEVYHYYYDTFGRRSYDGDGEDVEFYLDVSMSGGPNAWYDPGWDIFEFSDGYATRDVIAHEFTHAVTESEAGLIYRNQSGALNESYSDVFGAIVDDEDWLIGEDLPGGTLRDMSNPPAFGDPDHMNNFVVTTGDNGGVHTNSGIPNKVAYMLGHGDTHPVSGVVVRGIGREKTARLFYDVLTTRLGSSSNFRDFRYAMVEQARNYYYLPSVHDYPNPRGLYGFTEADISSVIDAFTAVGLGLPDTTPAEVQIVAPTGSSSHVHGTGIYFSADIHDDESGLLDGNAVIWQSNRDGQIGSGRSFTTSSLSYGAHVVTVTVTNAAGLVSTATVNVSVINTPPDVQILTPANGARLYAGASVDLLASVSDNDTLPDSQVRWYANGTFLGTGRSRTATLSAGTVTLMVRATDSQGVQDSASVTVTVLIRVGAVPVITSITVPDRVLIAGYDSAKGMHYADVDLAGTATDAEDGPLTGSRLQWTTNRTDLQSGSLGSGTSRRVRLYSPDVYGARHLITLTATDSSGQSVSVTRELVLWNFA